MSWRLKRSPLLWILFPILLVSAFFAWSRYQRYSNKERPMEEISKTETVSPSTLGEGPQSHRIQIDEKKQASINPEFVFIQKGALRLERSLPAKVDLDPARHYVIAAPYEVTFERQLQPLGSWVQAGDPILELSSPEVPVLRGSLRRQQIQLEKANDAVAWFTNAKRNMEVIIREVETSMAQGKAGELSTELAYAETGAKLLAAYTRFRSAVQLIDASSLAGSSSAIPQKTIIERTAELEAARYTLMGTISQSRFESDQALLHAQSELAAAKGNLDGLISELRRFLGVDQCSEANIREFLDGADGDRFLHRAPASGILLERYFANGERAPAGAELLLLTDLTHIFAVAELRQQDWDLLNLKKGDTVELQSPSIQQGKSLPGKLELISSTAKEKTNMLRLTASFDNPDFLLRPGMLTRIVIAENRYGLLVPIDALFMHDGHNYVVTKSQSDPNHFEVVPVRLGPKNQTHAELLEGPAEGTSVVTKGLFALASQAFLEAEE